MTPFLRNQVVENASETLQRRTGLSVLISYSNFIRFVQAGVLNLASWPDSSTGNYNSALNFSPHCQLNVLFFFASCPRRSGIVLSRVCSSSRCSPSQSQAHSVRGKMISIDPRAAMLRSVVLQQKAATEARRIITG